jgi:tetratricopeptide (TPR) repeat protein
VLNHAFKLPGRTIVSGISGLLIGSMVTLVIVQSQPMKRDPEANARQAVTSYLDNRVDLQKVKADIAAWKVELKQLNHEDFDTAGRLQKCLGLAYYDLAYPDSNSYTEEMSKARRDHLLAAAQFLQQAQGNLVKNPDACHDLSEVYERLTLIYSSDKPPEAYKFANLRVKLVGDSNDFSADEKVMAFNTLGKALFQLHRFNESKEALLRAIAIDKEYYGEQGMGFWVEDAYTYLHDTLSSLNRLEESLQLTNECIARKSSAYGENYSMLSYNFDQKANLLLLLGRTEEARKATARAEHLRRYGIPALEATSQPKPAG